MKKEQDLPLVFLDTETHAVENPIPIQIAAKYPNGEINEYFSTWGVPINLMAMSVHHITENFIKNKPTFQESEYFWEIKKICKENILVAHNSAFDAGVLEDQKIPIPRQICTLKLARYIFPELECHKLQYLRYYLELEEENITAHDAMSDVIILEGIFWKIFPVFKRLENIKDSSLCLEKMIEISSRPSLLYKCTFGKYKGTLWEDIPQDYLDWIVNKSTFDDPNVLYTAKYYLVE